MKLGPEIISTEEVTVHAKYHLLDQDCAGGNACTSNEELSVEFFEVHSGSMVEQNSVFQKSNTDVQSFEDVLREPSALIRRERTQTLVWVVPRTTMCLRVVV